MADEQTWPMKIPLEHPIKITRGMGEDAVEHEISELSLKKLKAKHLKYVPAEMKTAYFIVPLIAALAGITESEAGELDMGDILAAAEKLLPLLEGLPGIGMK